MTKKEHLQVLNNYIEWFYVEQCVRQRSNSEDYETIIKFNKLFDKHQEQYEKSRCKECHEAPHMENSVYCDACHY